MLILEKPTLLFLIHLHQINTEMVQYGSPNKKNKGGHYITNS